MVDQGNHSISTELEVILINLYGPSCSKLTNCYRAPEKRGIEDNS